MAKSKYRVFKPTDTSIIGMMEDSLKRNWERPCVTNYGTGESYTYGDVAKMIVRLHHFFRQLGIEPGNKIALCDKNNAHWGISFFAAFSYGAVVVPNSALSRFRTSTITPNPASSFADRNMPKGSRHGFSTWQTSP